MSAFVIDAGAMDQVIRALFGRTRYGQIVPRFDGAFTAPGHPGSADPTETGRKLFTMNVEAVTQRYLDCRANPKDLPGPAGAHLLPTAYRAPERLARPLDQATMVACYKAIKSLLYQCSEGDMPDSPLYGELERAAGQIAGDIVRDLPAYQAAAW
jgi:hypothetical protein